MTDVHVVVPGGIDDPQRPSGGNVYDRRVMRELSGLGWAVHEHAVPGSWPNPSSAGRSSLAEVVGSIPDRSVLLADGLVASTAPEVLVPGSRRLRLVVLVHMPLIEAPSEAPATGTGEREQEVLSAASAVVTTSAWARRRLLDRHGLVPGRVHVAEPGADPAPLAAGTPTGGELLCVAAVAPHKGHDVLLDAMGTLREATWRCTCVGRLDRDPDYVDRLRDQMRRDGIGERVRFTGPLTGAALDDAYAGADVLVLASRGETYAMVVTEALARGLPVLATTVGGLPEALGHGADGTRPGVLVPPDDPGALAKVLSGWLDDADLRQRLRHTAAQRRLTLPRWASTADRISQVLAEVG